MLDQYDGYLKCKINFNDGYFAECDIVDAHARNPALSIDDEFWLGPDRLQVHGQLLGLSTEAFLLDYPPGKEFLVELRVKIIEAKSQWLIEKEARIAQELEQEFSEVLTLEALRAVIREYLRRATA
jgi:hypothetical protein